MRTRTGNFPIGFRQLNSKWQRDLPAVLKWAVQNDLEVIDLNNGSADAVKAVSHAGLRIGSIDLPDSKTMISADAARRADALARNSDCIRACTTDGPHNFFATMLPEDPALAPAENYGYMVESFGALAAVLEESGSHYVIEGWPGRARSAVHPRPFAPSCAMSPHPR